MKLFILTLQDVFKQLSLMLTVVFVMQIIAIPAAEEIEYHSLVSESFKIDRSSPAFIAIEHLDEFAEYSAETENFYLPTIDSVQLGVPVPVAEQIFVDLPLDRLTAKLNEDGFRHLAQDNMTIDVLSADVFLADSGAGISEPVDKVSDENRVIELADSDWMNSLDRQLKRRLLVADSRFGVLDKKWLAPSMDGLIHEIVQTEITRNPNIRTIPTRSGKPIIVMKTDQPELSKVAKTDTPKPPRLPTGLDLPVQGLEVIASSGYSTPGYPVRSGEVSMRHTFSRDWASSKAGRFSDPQFDGLSSTLLQVSKPSHWPSLKIAMASEYTAIKVFSDKMMEALLSSVIEGFDANGDEVRSYSIIYGEIQGEQLAGKKASLLNQPEAKPIYFNEAFLPDADLRETSSNGLFAFIGHGRGAFIVEIEDEKVGLAPQLVVTRPGHVSFVRVQESGLYSAEMQFDTFGFHQRLKMYNISLNEEETFTSFEHLNIDLPERANFNFIEFELEQGQIVRLMLNGFQALAQVPLFNDDVLSRLDKNVIVQPNTGMLAIYYEGEEFDLEARENQNNYSVDPLYLDLEGNFIEEFESPCYLVFPNLEPGIFEYSISQPSSEKLITGLAVIEESVITSQSVYRDNE